MVKEFVSIIDSFVLTSAHRYLGKCTVKTLHIFSLSLCASKNSTRVSNRICDTSFLPHCSLGSVGGSVASGSASRPGSTRSRRPPHQTWQGPSCLGALYQLLIAPFEDCLPATCSKSGTGTCMYHMQTVQATQYNSHTFMKVLYSGTPF